jgi:hypothetical protein
MTRDDEKLVSILASARAEALGTTEAAEREFSAKVLCLLFDPAKAKFPEHQPRAEALRRTFQGIANSPSLQATFRESLLPAILKARTLTEALELPFGTLMRELSLDDDA